MDTQLLMTTAMLAGKLMLLSGAETYRVEDTIHHILGTAENLEYAEVLVIMTGISATLKIKDEPAISLIKRVNSIGTNLSRIVSVNDISRRYCGGEISLEDAYTELDSLQKKVYRRSQYSLAVVGICVGFSLLFGGSICEIIASFAVGAFLAICIAAGKLLKFHAFLLDIFAAIGVAFATIIMKFIFGRHMSMDVVMISCIMPLVPGVAITNAVRDTLQGDYLSGAARLLEAFLKAAGIALGIGIGLALFSGFILNGGAMS
ncbi:threonine/serine exporter family protein [Roseburia hominis]